MAEAIPRIEWSEAEEYHQRAFYWDYLVSRWLVPGPAVLRGGEEEPLPGAPRSTSIHEYGWLLEPDSLVEQ